MIKNIKKIILFICIFSFIIFIHNISNANDLELQKLDYQVKLNSDGSADVVETWKIYIEDTNTLFKTFEVDKSKYKEIVDVKVEQIGKNGEEIEFSKIDEYKYHVDKNCYYALMYKGKFEIAWGAHAEDVVRTYKISYRIIDAVKNYTDCSEFYWQFISKESEIPAKLVTGTIYLPTPVSSLETLKVWAHGPLNGNIKIQDKNMITFEVQNLNVNTMLEARVIVPNSIFNLNKNIENTVKVEEILKQEQEWAKQANELRQKYKEQQERRQAILKLTTIILFMLGIVLGIFIIVKIIKYHKQLKNIPKMKPTQEMQYFRDIPDENSTPAQAGFLYYFKNSGLSLNISKIISATMLDLCMKKYIQFEEIKDKKDEIQVILKPNMDKEKLSKDEKIIYEVFEKVAKDYRFTMKEFEKYCRKNSNKMINTFNQIEKEAKQIQEENKNYDSQVIKKYSNWVGKAIIYALIAGLGMFSMLILYLLTEEFNIYMMQISIIPSIIATIYCSKIANRFNRLTQKGTDEKEKWEALKRYMRRLFYDR